MIPKKIQKIKGLSVFDRCLLTQICYFSKNRGYCFAKNDYFVEFFEVSLNTVKRSIRKMEKMGLITRVKGESNRRYIYATLPDQGKTKKNPENNTPIQADDAPQPVDQGATETVSVDPGPDDTQDMAGDQATGADEDSSPPRREDPTPPEKEETPKFTSYGYRLLQKMREYDQKKERQEQSYQQKVTQYHSAEDEVQLTEQERIEADEAFTACFDRWRQKVMGD